MTKISKPVLIIIAVIVVVALVVLVWAKVAAAQVITTPYWCSSYWSSQPCYNSNSYGNQYAYPYYGYYNNYYYPYNYNNYYRYSYPAPTCTLTYNYANTSYYGYYNNYYYQPITLSWSSTNTSSGYISPNVGSVSAFGMQVIYPNGNTTTYTMTVYGPGGSNSCQTTYYAPYYQPYWYPYNSYQYY
jgi:hypothetical protein